MSEIDNRKYILASIETAFLANGGREHDTKNCQCDASVGMCPCQYCAIHFALEQSETFIKATVQQDAELARLRSIIHDYEISEPIATNYGLQQELSRLREELEKAVNFKTCTCGWTNSYGPRTCGGCGNTLEIKEAGK